MKCNKCGKEIHDNSVMCVYCGNVIGQDSAAPAAAEPAAPEKKENVFTGIIGAILGAAVGALCIIVLGQLGYVASLSGLVLAGCTLKGYELLGRKLTTKGIIVSIILVAVTPYIADRIDWAILVLKEFSDYDINFMDAFHAIPEMIGNGIIESSAYYKNLAMIYLFAALGAVAALVNAFKNRK